MSGIGGGDAVARAVVKATNADVVIKVSPEFNYDEYMRTAPTLTEALAISAILKGLGKTPAIHAYPGFYAEDLPNLSNETIVFFQGAFLVGSSTPDIPLVSIASGLVLLTDIWSYTALGVHKTDLLRINGGNAFLNRCAFGFPQLDNADHALYIVDDAGIISFNGYYGWSLQESVIVEGQSAPYRHLLNSALDSFNKTPLKMLNASLGSLETTLYLMNCSLSSPFENILLSAEEYNGFYLYSTMVETDRMSLGGGLNQIKYWHGAKAIKQNLFPEPGESLGTVDHALNELNAWQELNEPAIRNNSSNIAAILAETELKGPFDGVVRDIYTDDDGIDPAKSYKYKIRPNSVLELGDFHDIDDFESYADTTALRAAWVASAPTQFQCDLELVEALEAVKSMKVTCGPSPTGAYLRYTYGSTQDQHQVCCVRGLVKGLVGTAFTIRARDSSGNFNTSSIIYPTPDKTYFSVPLTPDPSFDPLDVTDVDIVYSAGANGQTFTVDDLYFVGSDIFTADALIDEMDSVVADWTASGGSGLAISQNTTDKHSGTGSMQVDITGTAGGVSITRDDFVSGQDWGEDSALNIWVKITAVTASGVVPLQPRIYNLTNRIDLPIINIDSDRLGEGWYPIAVPFSRFDLGAGTIFSQVNVTRVEFYTPGTTTFRGTFLLDLFQRGYPAQVQSVNANKTFWPPSPHEGQGLIAIIEEHGVTADVDIDNPVLMDVSMISINPFRFDMIDEDPPYQIFGELPIELRAWHDVKQAGANFITRVMAFGIVNVDGQTWSWR